VGNLITGFNGTVTISDPTGTIYEGAPLGTGPGDVTIQFANGIYDGSGGTLYITGAQAGIVITVYKGGISNDSVAFTVEPAVLDSFTVEAQGGGSIGTQAADTAFNIDITAYDVYGNVLSSGPNEFVGTVDISDTTTTIAPVVSGVFVAGVRTESVQVTQAAVGDVITVTNSVGVETGASNAFTVVPGVLDHFTFDLQPVATYEAGEGIAVRIFAEDVQGNLKTGYTQGVTVSDSTGTISEGAPGSGDTVITFTNGVYNAGAAANLFVTQLLRG